jgi:hypothetical protein
LGDLDGRLSPLGLRVGYHNHSIEFRPAGGSTPWDILFGETPAGVVMQVDLGNARIGGADPATLIERYPGRAKTIHVKDYLPGRADVQIGSSDFDWARLQRACRSAGGTEWYIIEHASETMDEIAESLRRFRSVLVDETTSPQPHSVCVLSELHETSLSWSYPFERGGGGLAAVGWSGPRLRSDGGRACAQMACRRAEGTLGTGSR